MTLTPLIGREPETRRIAGLLDGVSGRGGALLVRGAAGLGKTALLAEAAHQARQRGMTVLATTGVQAEANLPFAALHLLLRPLLPLVDNLPETQRVAIRTAFCQSDGPAPERFLIALAVLGLLAEAAQRTPLLLVVDDAHWLDPASTDILAFVARRVGSDPIIMLGAVREEGDCARLESCVDLLVLGGLDEDAARELLRTTAPGLAPSVCERLLRVAQGNPLALLELPEALGDSVRVGGALLPSRLPLTKRLERAFAARLAALPPATRVLLQVAAAADGEVLTEILRAAEAMDELRPEPADLDPAIDAGLVHVDGLALRFRHPLVRSAVYQASSIAERTAAHRALAVVLAADPDRRVRHRASAALGRDPQIAAELEACAERSADRGDLVAAVAGYQRAAELSTEETRRGALKLRAAEAAGELGMSELVRRLLHEANAHDLGPVERARALWLGDGFRDGSERDAAAVDVLLDTAAAMAAHAEPDLALNLLTAAAERCLFGNLGGETVGRLIEVTERTGVAHDDPRRLRILSAAAPLARDAEVYDRLGAADPGDPEAARLLVCAANDIGAFHEAPELCVAATALLREQGRLGELARVLTSWSWSSILAGDFTRAALSADEGARLAAETNQPVWEMSAASAQATLAALRGEREAAEEMSAWIENAASPRDAAFNLALVQYTRGIGALGRGSHAEAYRQLRRVFEPADPAGHCLVACYAIGDLAAAAVYSGHEEEARVLLGEVEAASSLTSSPGLRVCVRHAQILLADEKDVEVEFKRALGEAEPARRPFLQARLHLEFGEWLRCQRRMADSRAELRAARDSFDALDASPWGEQARRELRATGETGGGRGPGTLEVLTTQELQIARMVAGGMSNREIGQRLHLSHRTVESHLYHAFPKLGVRSRAQLRGVLAGPRIETAG